MALADKLQEAVAKYLAEIVLGLALSGLAAVALLVDRVLPPAAFEELGSYATGRIVLALCLVILGLVAWVIYLHPRLKFEPETGTFIHKKTGMRYCGKCRVSKRLKAPMRLRSEGRGWGCMVCGTLYDDQNFKEPPPPPQRKARNGWMRI